MIRLDKYLCDMNIGTRSNVKQLIKKGNVTVNDTIIKNNDFKVAESDKICVNGRNITYQKYFYYMLNKPAGYVSATVDSKETTVMNLLKEYNRPDLFPVGRLDKDTEGLLLISNDGILAHDLLSPKKHISKKYFVILKESIHDEQIVRLESGVDIGEKNITLPALIEKLDETSLNISITEGKFHQIKRMFEAVSNKVIYLKRISMGKIMLDERLSLGEFRPLTEEEITILKTFVKRED